MLKLYGLKNCDTCRKARKWLDAEGIGHEFHDLRDGSLDAGMVAGWLTAVGPDKLVNRRGTTWRQLADHEKQDLDAAKAQGLILAHPALIKRPVIVDGDRVSVGFTADIQAALKG